ncbi:MAG TPA: amino acid ABC transporter substrate-binding protein [Rhodoblastus sp.]|nr:amino acid ABC transporter substrate-binding protein [Rhodoblastus sp.]
MASRILRTAALALLGFVAQFGAAQAQATLSVVKARGSLSCGVSQGLAGFSQADASGKWSGFDVDFCRAIAAAIFDDPNRVSFKPLSAEARFDALKKGEIDVLSRNSTWTMGREAALGLRFAGVTYYDGQGFLVAREPAVMSPLDLADVKICAQAGTTNRDNAVDFLTANNVKHEIVEVGNPDEMVAAYQDARCNVMTADSSQLHALQIRLAKPGAAVILPDVISKEPLGPVVRQDDSQWFEIVKWTHFAMLDAEELGVSTRTLPAALASAKPDVRRLVGADGAYGEQIGLTKDWVVRIVRAVGNYGESFERNVGTFSNLGIPRGLNQLWSRGGIQYAPPIR